MKKPILYAIIGFIFLSGCAPVNTVLMKNPDTGDVKECKRDPLKNWSWQEEAVIRECVRKYEKAGYKEVD